MAEKILFFVFAVPLVLTAIGVLASRSPVYAAMNLVAAFFCMAGIYILLTAHLIAFMQILVYAGAVMVLFLFVIMLLSIGDEHLLKERKRPIQLVGVAGGLGVLAVLCAAIWPATGGGGAFAEPSWPNLAVDFRTVKAVGRLLFTQY